MSHCILNVIMPDTDLPLALLVGYVEEPDVYELPAPEYHEDESEVVGEIRPEDVPVGNTTEDRRERNRLIRQLYFQWLDRNESRKEVMEPRFSIVLRRLKQN